MQGVSQLFMNRMITALCPPAAPPGTSDTPSWPDWQLGTPGPSDTVAGGLVVEDGPERDGETLEGSVVRVGGGKALWRELVHDAAIKNAAEIHAAERATSRLDGTYLHCHLSIRS